MMLCLHLLSGSLIFLKFNKLLKEYSLKMELSNRIGNRVVKKNLRISLFLNDFEMDAIAAQNIMLGCWYPLFQVIWPAASFRDLWEKSTENY